MESKDLSFSPHSAHPIVLSHLSHRDNGMYLIYLMCWEGIVWIEWGPEKAGKEIWLKERWDDLAEVNNPFLAGLCSWSGKISKLNVEMRLKIPKESDTEVRAN